MSRDGVDAIICLHNSGGWDYANANGRYLSGIGGNGSFVSVVFPQVGEVTAITGPIPTPDYWLRFQDWVSDVRTTFFDLTTGVIERLHELGVERGRIGIAGLANVARAREGLVIHGAYVALEAAFPHAEFVNATGLLYEARFVKSDEEVAMLTQAVSLVETALDVLEREAQPGVPESVVYARMAGSLVENGGEPNTLLLWAAGDPLPPAAGMLPSRRRLGPNDVIQVELDARWCGYLGHGTTTTWVGKPDTAYRNMAALQREAARRCCEALAPGRELGECVEICAELAAGSPFECHPIVHSRGVGQDMPVLVFRARDELTRHWRLEENAVFTVKPRVSTPDGSRTMVWGDTVVVASNGGRRLGTRPSPLSEEAAEAA
jgi:Xaa-Pro aminopeptidase